MVIKICLIILGCCAIFGIGYYVGGEVKKLDLEQQKLETNFYKHWIETMQAEFDKYIIKKISEEES